MKVSFIGLGAMGFPMAGHLYTAGHIVSVFNRTSSKACQWTEKFKGESFDSPGAACHEADVVLLCVGNDNDVREVVLGKQGVIHTMPKGSVLVDHTTTSADLAKELNNVCVQKGVFFLDAPVSGGQAGAENGKLTVMLGGEATSYSRIKEVLNCYSQKHELMGGVGSGQLTKMVNQICIAGLVQGLSEALNFAQNAQLDVAKVVEVISKGAAQSWQMDNRWSSMTNNEFDFGFAVDWMRKDLGIVLDEANRNQSSLPVTSLVDQFYAKIQSNGGNRYDTSSLITLLK